MITPDSIRQSVLDSQLGKNLTSSELELIISYNQMPQYTAGELILQQGKESPGIFIIIQGKVKETAKILGENVTELEMVEVGDSFGESSFIEKIPSPTSFTAVTDTLCLLLTHTYLDLISQNFPETKYKLFNALSLRVCKHLKVAHDHIIELISSADMSTESLFMEIIHSFTKPSETTLSDQHIEMQRLMIQPLFQQFSADEIQELFAHSKLLRCARQCTLIHKDETTPCCYIVIQGAVISGIIHDKKFAKLSVIGPYTLFANAACFLQSPHFTITFSTCEEAILLKLDAENLAYFQKVQPLLWYKLFNLICRSLIELDKSVNKLEIRLSIEKYNR